VLRILLLAVAITVPLVAGTPGDAGAGDPRDRTPGVAITATGAAGGPMSGGPMSGDTMSGDTVPGDTDPGDTVPGDTVPTDTANPFLPEERDLTDCLGLLQRPGCGSEARGGLGQTLVAVAMISGLVLIFGRVAWGVRRNRGRQALPTDADRPAGSAGNDSAGNDSAGNAPGDATDTAAGDATGDQGDGDTVDTAPRGDAS